MIKKILFYFFILALIPVSLNSQITVTGSTSVDGSYTSLTVSGSGAFEAINSEDQTGNSIVITITANSLSETGEIALTGAGGAWTTLTIYPTNSGDTIRGNYDGPLLTLDGADNVTIDGRVNQAGSTANLVITNTSTGGGASTIMFTNSAESNTVKYSYILGSSTNSLGGVIFFSISSGGNGNDSNTIDNNFISGDAAGRPIYSVYSEGADTYENSGIVISNNNFYDFLSREYTPSSAILFSAYTTACTISGNSFYETTTLTFTTESSSSAINIENASGSGFQVTGNYIGGNSSLASGTWTKNNANGVNNNFTAIFVNVGTAGATSIQGNTISNITWSNNTIANWTGIHIAGGVVNVGTISGNTIGAGTGINSINITNGEASDFYAINISSTGTVDCQNNIIGSITTGNVAGQSTNFYGIYKSVTSGTTTINYNTIGSTVTASSIRAGSLSTSVSQSVYGIYSVGTGTVSINFNTIANLTNSTTNTGGSGVINGITSKSGTLSILSNTIRDLTIANGNTSTTNNASVCGIALSGTSIKNVSKNTIYNLSNTKATFATGAVIGIHYASNTTAGVNFVKENFIHSLSVNGTTTANIYGIKIGSGACTYANNIINLGSGTSVVTIWGIYDPGTACNIVFNSVYIGGTPSTGSLNSYALYNASNTGIKTYKNNILDNSRSGGSGKHYAIYLNTVITNLQIDYNDYYAPNTGGGGVLGYKGSNQTTLALWKIATSQDLNSLNVDPQFASAGGTSAINYKPASTILAGTTLAIVTTDYATTVRAGTPTIGAYEGTLSLNVDVFISSVFQSTYFRLKDAFDKINSGVHTGAIEIRIKGSTTETESAILRNSSYSAINIYPTLTGISISGNVNGPLIDFDGADNVVLDGRVNASGTLKDLIINNTSTGATASTIRYINSAENNTVKYCNISGSSTNSTGGIILFSTATSGNGNDGITVDNNNITCSADISRPYNAIYSAGSIGYENTGIIITNNSIYNFLNRSTASNGININANSSTFTISGNSFYETVSFIPTAGVTYNALIINNTSGESFTINNNFFGGSAVSCGGAAWTKTSGNNNVFNAISLTVGTGVNPSNLNNNTIKNFVWSNSGAATWTAINIQDGDVNIGTGTGNIIGATTGTGSIVITNGATNANVYGIYINTPNAGTVDCQNNSIGSIIATNSAANSTNFYGIYKSSSPGITSISSNIIGSTSTANSINSTSTSTGSVQSVFGIQNNGSETITINGNTIANLINGTTNSTVGTAGLINGISTTAGVVTISNNTVRDLTIANANNSATLTAAVAGIVLSGVDNVKTVSGNTIYNLSNSYSSFSGRVVGIYFSGNTGSNAVKENFIHSLSVTGGSSTASIFGIQVSSGATTYSNNIISIGGSTLTTIYGIYETGAAGNNNNLYFNTVYIFGSVASGSNNSYALYSAVNTNTRNFRNNIFTNFRSTSGGVNLHFAEYIANTGGSLTNDYNDYYVTGEGTILGFYGGNQTALPIYSDVNSSIANPTFTNPGTSVAADYNIGASLPGITGTGITVDFGLNSRGTSVSMGAWETTINMWIGTTSTNFSVTTNWTGGTVPGVDGNIVFDANPANHCYLDQDRSVTNISNAQSTDRLVTNGFKLTIKGSLNLTNGAQIDASSANSTIEFAGSSSQSIPAGTFLSNQVRNLIINNTNNVVLNGTLNLLGSLTATSGRLDAFTNSPTVSYSSVSGGQSIESNTYLNERIYNLTIANSSGVAHNASSFTVSNNLSINSGAIYDISLGNFITVTNTSTIAGTLNLRSGASGTASLITGSVGGAGTTNFERYITLNQWHTLSSAVTGQSIQSFILNAANHVPSKGSSPTTYGMEYYDEPSGVWTYYTSSNIGSAGNFGAGKGYITRSTASGVVTFTGALIAGNISPLVTRSNNGWNAIGNPYSSAIGLNSGTASPDNFLLYNATIGNFDPAYAAAYFWNNSGYTIFNNASGATYIQPGQGFLIKAKTGGGDVDFTPSMQIHQANPTFYKKTSDLNWGKIQLIALSDSDTSTTSILYRDDMTRGLDITYDAGLFGGNADFQLYTKLVDDYGVNFAIQCLSSTETDSMQVPVGLDFAEGGLVTFSANTSSIPLDYSVIFEDRLLGYFTDLSIPSAKYVAMINPATSGTGRFFLHNVVPSNGLNYINRESFNVYSVKKEIYISTSSINNSSVASIYDLLGRKVGIYELEPSNLNVIDASALIPGIYLVNVSNNGILSSRKVYIGD